MINPCQQPNFTEEKGLYELFNTKNISLAGKD